MVRKFKKRVTFLSEADLKRRKRELLLIAVIIGIVSLLSYAINQLVYRGGDVPVSNTVLMFILININLLLLILLIFLVVRNLVKLLYDRKRKVMGARLRTRLVVAFVALTLLPTGVLFIFSINFINTSIEFWFNVPVEQALDNSLRVGRRYYEHVEQRNLFFLRRIAWQMKARNYPVSWKQKEMVSYFQDVREEFNLHVIELYSRSGKRIALVRSPDLENIPVQAVSPEVFGRGEEERDTRSAFLETPLGELNRIVGTVPFGAAPSEAVGFIAVSTLISPELVENLASISRGIEEYQQIKLLKQPILVTYYITLSIVALLVVFCAVWFGFYLAKSISIPIKELAEGTRRVAGGDLGFSIVQVADDEIGSLVDSFNRMTCELRGNREQLELSARMLREQNTELEGRRQFMEIVLKNVSTGVITLDAEGMVITVNKSAERMLNIRAEDVLSRNYRSLLGDQQLDLASEVMENLNASPHNAIQMGFRLTINGQPRSFLAFFNALRNDTGHRIGLVMVFDDLTEQEKAQRMAAWREVARRIAHEVKNPLTPISLSAQRLKRRYSERINEPVFDECTRMIIDHVELIRNLVNAFSSFARFPTANPVLCELPPIIEETIALYREGHPDVGFEFRVSENMVPLNLDRQQIKQAMINLMDNAIAAMKQTGKIALSLDHDPALRIVRLEVADTGPGISDEDKTRLFEPYFSTKKTGMGLGLTIVNSIIADHKGMIRVQDNLPCGTIFIIDLPV